MRRMIPLLLSLLLLAGCDGNAANVNARRQKTYNAGQKMTQTPETKRRLFTLELCPPVSCC